MKKVCCNVFYEPKAYFTRWGVFTEYSLGYFVDEKDSLDAVNLLLRAVKVLGEELGIEASGSYVISEKLIPETSSTRYYRTLAEFKLTDNFVSYYLQKYHLKEYLRLKDSGISTCEV